MPKNDYARRLEKQRRAESEIVLRWTAQLCLDVMTIVLNDPEVMGRDVFGPVRLNRVGKAFNKLFADVAVGLSGRPEASYVRAKVDERLARIMGEAAEAWPDRYPYWDDRGI